MAQFLRTEESLNKAQIGNCLGSDDPFNLQAMKEYVGAFRATKGKMFDQSLREFQSAFRMPGEAQKIDRILNAFGSQYYLSDTSTFGNEDAVYVLAFSCIMLNSDLHNESVKTKM